MKVSARQFAQSLYEAVEKNPSKRAVVVKNFLKVLGRRKQNRLLPVIMRTLDDVAEQATKTTLITIETPFNISKTNINNLLKAIKKNYNLQKYKTKIVINPDILGGVKIRFNDVVIDGTVQSRIIQMKHILSEA